MKKNEKTVQGAPDENALATFMTKPTINVPREWLDRLMYHANLVSDTDASMHPHLSHLLGYIESAKSMLE
jgi:hypothetical protein